MMRNRNTNTGHKSHPLNSNHAHYSTRTFFFIWINLDWNTNFGRTLEYFSLKEAFKMFNNSDGTQRFWKGNVLHSGELNMKKGRK